MFRVKKFIRTWGNDFSRETVIKQLKHYTDYSASTYNSELRCLKRLARFLGREDILEGFKHAPVDIMPPMALTSEQVKNGYLGLKTPLQKAVYLFFCLTIRRQLSKVKKMWVIQYFDWQGTMEELEEFDKIVEKACEKAEGVKYKGRHGPHSKKYHWAYFYKVEGYNQWFAMGANLPRDYSKMSHTHMEVFGP